MNFITLDRILTTSCLLPDKSMLTSLLFYLLILIPKSSELTVEVNSELILAMEVQIERTESFLKVKLRMHLHLLLEDSIEHKEKEKFKIKPFLKIGYYYYSDSNILNYNDDQSAG